MAKKSPVFNYSLCVACGICVQTCPVSVLVSTKQNEDIWKNVFPEFRKEAHNNVTCISCGLCEKACPMSAIKMTEIVEEVKND